MKYVRVSNAQLYGGKDTKRCHRAVLKEVNVFAMETYSAGECFLGILIEWYAASEQPSVGYKVTRGA